MWERIRRVSLTQWIPIGMGIGVVVGWAAPDAAQGLRPFSSVFLRMIKSIIDPILFATLVIGIAGHGDDLRRRGGRAMRMILQGKGAGQ